MFILFHMNFVILNEFLQFISKKEIRKKEKPAHSIGPHSAHDHCPRSRRGLVWPVALGTWKWAPRPTCPQWRGSWRLTGGRSRVWSSLQAPRWHRQATEQGEEDGGSPLARGGGEVADSDDAVVLDGSSEAQVNHGGYYSTRPMRGRWGVNSMQTGRPKWCSSNSKILFFS
jgi:hypothetical protein